MVVCGRTGVSQWMNEWVKTKRLISSIGCEFKTLYLYNNIMHIIACNFSFSNFYSVLVDAGRKFFMNWIRIYLFKFYNIFNVLLAIFFKTTNVQIIRLQYVHIKYIAMLKEVVLKKLAIKRPFHSTMECMAKNLAQAFNQKQKNHVHSNWNRWTFFRDKKL